MNLKKPLRFNYLFAYSILFSIIFIFLFLAYREEIFFFTRRIILIVDLLIITAILHLEIIRKRAFYTLKLFLKTGSRLYLYLFLLLITGWLFIYIGNKFKVIPEIFLSFALIFTQIELFIFIFLFIRFYSQYVESAKLDAPHYVVIGFISLIVIGAFILYEPSAHENPISFIDALFTSTSAVCVTGLTVNIISNSFSKFGLIIILFLIQFGGLGIMILYASFILFFTGNMSLKGFEITIKATEISGKYNSFQKTIIFILIYTFIIEFFVLILLALRFFSLGFDLNSSIKYGIFHSISAFCNAGFSLFPNSFLNYKGDISINLILISLITLGGIGFVVNFDIFRYLINKLNKSKKYITLSIQSRIVLNMYLLINLISCILFLLIENNNALSELLPHEKFIASLFQVVTARTAGFNTIDLSLLSQLSKTLLEILMIVGASSGSTGGGIKVTTFFIILFTIYSFIKQKDEVILYNHKISKQLIIKSFSLFFTYIIVILISYSLLLVFDKNDPQKLLFEVISALGTVGLSMGITPTLTDLSKVIIMILMFIGRVGPLTVFTALSFSRKNEPVSYPETEIMVG